MICTLCHNESEPGVKYCVICGALLPLDAESAPFFSSLFRVETPEEAEPDPVEEQDVATAVNPAAHVALPTATPVPDPTTVEPAAAIPSLRTFEWASDSPRTPVPPERRGTAPAPRKRSRALLIGLSTLAMAFVFVTGFVVANLGGTTNAGTVQSAPTGVSSAASTSTTPPPLPTGAATCSGTDGVGRNTATSCDFAANVADAVRKSPESTPSQVTAYSPVTKKTYELTCTREEWVVCKGGNNAVVYVWPRS